jgi:hypothetical protein
MTITWVHIAQFQNSLSSSMYLSTMLTYVWLSPFPLHEKAVLPVHNNLFRSIGNGQVAAFVHLDLSSAFHIVFHDILLTVLANRYLSVIPPLSGSVSTLHTVSNPSFKITSRHLHSLLCTAFHKGQFLDCWNALPT